MSDGHSSKAPKGAAPSPSSAKATARHAAAAAASSTSDGGWHSGITPAISPTSSGPAHLPHSSSTPASATPKGSPPTVINVPARREGPRGSAGGAAAAGAVPPLSISIGSANSSGSASPPSLPPAGGSAAPSPKTDPPPRPPRQASTTSTREDSPADDDRGWDAVMDGRFRIALMHRFAEDVDGESGNGSGSGPQLSAFANCLPEEMNADAAAECEEDANRTPTHDAFCNQCQPGEPRIEVDVEASLVNAINSAYTSTGYPFVVTAGNARGAVYGSFVDTSNPTISSLELPPQQSYIVAPSYTGGQAPAQGGVTEMDTLLAIYWARGDRMMTTAGTAAAAAVAASQGKAASKDAKATSPGSAPPPSSAGPAGTPHNPAVARTIAHHLSQYPEGIHGIHSSMHLRTVLVEGKLPAEPAFAPSAPLHTMAAVPLAVAGGNVIAPPASTSPPPAPPAAAPAAAAAGAGGTENAADDATAAAAAGGPPASTSPTTAMPPNGEANVPPLPRPLESNAPVQFTLVSASTFNHLTVYVVAHQDGKMLYNAALQSLSASIATRKVTAHQLILVGREEINAVSSDPLAAVTQPPPRRTKISFANVPATGSEAAMLLHSKTSRFAGADAARRTVSAAPVRFTVEPHLLFGNQNGDLFVFSMLQERIVQHINFNAGSQQVSSSIASGNSGVGSKLICSPVSAIVEVQNGIEKKITSMVQYATVAKRNHRSSFECDDVPSSFTPTGAAAPSHYYYPVPPSLYAVGFDNGQMLLICVTCEGGWMLRHFSSQYFGLRPIHAIAVRVPPFFTRLWTSSLPPIARLDAKTAALPAARSIEKTVTALVTPEQALLVHEEDSHIAAVACNGGVIALVKLPGLEILSSVATTDYNAVGEILALQWTATATSHLLTPDVLVATGEDDTMTAFQLVSQFLISAGESNHNHNNNANNGLETVSHLSSTESILAGGRLRILEKKKFHRSWVNRLHLLPVVLPATPSRAGSRSDPRGVARRNSNNNSTGPKRAVCAATGGGMPHYLGVCLIATSYDRRTSFWPYIFANAEEYADESGVRRSGEASTGNGSLTLPPAENSDFLNASASLTGAAGATAGGTAAAAAAAMSAAAPDHYVLVDGPTAAYPLHTELVVSVAAAGGGTSFFLTTVCCRGKVKFWSVSVKV